MSMANNKLSKTGNSMAPVGMLSDVTGMGIFKMAATEPEMDVSRLEDK